MKTYFILLVIHLQLKSDLPISGPYLSESQRSPQMYDLLSAYITNMVIRMLRNGICVFKYFIRNHVLNRIYYNWTSKCENVSSGIRGQPRPRTAFASAQSDQGLPCPLAKSLDTTDCMTGETKARMIFCACA